MKPKKQLFLFVLFILAANIAYADGMHLSDTAIHLYEPNQKAVISWDGKTETMVLSSAVRSENISNFAWVVPIQSAVKPEVTAGNISLFQDLVKYFERVYDGGDKRTLQAETGAGVEVLESKEIDIYDITILKATSSDDLIKWLTDNGYNVPEDAKAVFDKYIAKGDYYFVANKIDLKNKYKEAVDFVEAFNEENESYADERMMLNFVPSYFSSSIVNYIVTNVPYSLVRQDEISFIQRERYEQLKGEYGVNVDERFASLSNGLPFYQLVNLLGNCDNLECIEYLNFDCRNDSSTPYTLMYYVSEKWAVSSRWRIFLGECSDVTDAFGSLEEAKQAMSKIPYDKIFENINIVKLELSKMAEEQNKKILPMREKLQEMSNIKLSLMQGLATPLKFEFQPPQPYYPLEISSLNSGSTFIEVYVLGANPVKDKNSILKVDESKEINAELRKKLQTQINLADAKYVTRLSYGGDLRRLNADAEFERGEMVRKPPVAAPAKKYNFIQDAWRWLSGLFGKKNEEMVQYG